MAPSAASWGVTNQKGKLSQGWGSRLVRSLSTGVKERRRTSPAWKIYVISFSSSLHLICNLLSSFPLVFLFKLILPCLCLFQSVFCYFLQFSTHSLPFSLSLFQHPFLFLSSGFSSCLSDTEGWYCHFPSSLSHSMAVSMGALSGREGLVHLLHYQCLTSRWARQKVPLIQIITRHLECIEKMSW